MRNLDIPKAVEAGHHVQEMARIWAVDGKQIVAFNRTLWDDPAAWGIFLADFAAHIAQAYTHTKGGNESEYLFRILEGLQAEIGSKLS